MMIHHRKVGKFKTTEKTVISINDEKKKRGDGRYEGKRGRKWCIAIVFATITLSTFFMYVCGSCRQHLPYIIWKWGGEVTIAIDHVPILSWVLIFMFPDYKLTKPMEACGSSDQTPLRAWMKGSPAASSFSSSYDGTGAIFIVGCGHSGTTHLIDMLSRHPEIKAFGNLPNKEYSVTPHSFGDSKLRFASGMIQFQRHDDLEFYKSTRRSGKTHWVVKSPSNVCRLGYILNRLPKAKVIVMVRDGRDVFLSLRERLSESFGSYRDDEIERLALNRWVDDNNQALKWKDDPRVLFVRVEDISNKEWNRVLSHIGVTSNSLEQNNNNEDGSVFSGQYLETPPKDSSAFSELLWYMYVRVLRSRGEIQHNRARSDQIMNNVTKTRWRQELNARQIDLFRSNLGAMSLMVSFGYHL